LVDLLEGYSSTLSNIAAKQVINVLEKKLTCAIGNAMKAHN